MSIHSCSVVEGVGRCLDILWPFFWSTNKFYTLEKSLAFEEHESSDLHLSEYVPFGLNGVSTESNKCSPLLAKDNIQVGGSDGVQILTITSVYCAVGPSVTMSSTDFSFQNLVFWNLFEFSAADITLKTTPMAHSNSSKFSATI